MFFERLQDMCLAQNTDVTNLLKKLGLSTSKGTAWKNGTIPNGKILGQLSDFFNVSTDYLLGKTDIRKPTPDGESGLSVPEERLITLFRQIPLDSQGLVVSMIETALKSQGLL